MRDNRTRPPYSPARIALLLELECRRAERDLRDHPHGSSFPRR